jgi:hypothetical protein
MVDICLNLDLVPLSQCAFDLSECSVNVGTVKLELTMALGDIECALDRLKYEAMHDRRWAAPK